MSEIGRPIPLGIIHPEDFDKLSITDPTSGAGDSDLESIRSQIADLRGSVKDLAKTTARTIEAHPLIAATAISLGLWALVGLTARRGYRLRD